MDRPRRSRGLGGLEASSSRAIRVRSRVLRPAGNGDRGPLAGRGRRASPTLPRVRAEDDRIGRVHVHQRTNRRGLGGSGPPRDPSPRALGWRAGGRNRPGRAQYHARSRRRDSIPERIGSVPGMSASPPLPPRTMQTRSDNRRARLVVGPDANLDPDGILDLLLSATERLSIETFYIEDRWRNTTNPFLEGAFDAPRRGVTVWILLDGSWSSVEADTGTNDDVVARINRRAKEEHLPVEARLLEPRGSIQRLHNKGVVVDGRAVLVSSMYWALGSATENREIGVLLEDRGIATEEGPELAEGEKKHEAAATDLKGIEAHEAKAREAEAGVLYFAIAASIVATVGL